MGKIAYTLCILFLCVVMIKGYQPVTYASVKGNPYTVTYDTRSFFINGSRVLFFGGSVHYPRSTPEMWPQLFKMAVESGMNTIETYVFWNFHEAERGVYDFTGRGDLLLFIKTAAEYNLFVNLRVGPFVGGEWYYGGFPLWLRDIPGIAFRTYNQPFMNEMTIFMKYIMNLVAPYLPSNGGNIIIAQVENEYGGGNTSYVNFCGELAESLNVGIPWIMCNGNYANNTILTCNGCFCDSWVEWHWNQQPTMPAAWTENEGWYDQWGKARLIRHTTDMAYSVARYVAYGGTYHNYYMWHGGNNYGYTSAAAVTTAYANDVSIDSLGLPTQPKFDFLGSLHILLGSYGDVLLAQDPPTPLYLIDNTVDWVNYGPISFLSNQDSNNGYTVQFFGKEYYLSPLSLIIFDDLFNILFNTSNVSNDYVPHPITVAAANLTWQSWTEPVGPNLTSIVKNPFPYDSLRLTPLGTDYVWYSTIADIVSPGDLTIESSEAISYSVFVDGVLMGQNWDITKDSSNINLTVYMSSKLEYGVHKIDILSGSLGIDSNGIHAETFTKGIIGDVFIGQTNITAPEGGWVMQGQLVGESLEIFNPSNLNLVPWTANIPTNGNPITWYYTKFATPTTPGSVALDVTGLGKGLAWVNGNNIGRYWTLPGVCSGIEWCSVYAPSNCSDPNQPPTQILYHIPPDWLNENVNTLVIFEELGAPNINLAKIIVAAPTPSILSSSPKA